MVLKRLLLAVVALLIVSVISFSLMELVPGGPTAAYADNPKISQVARERIIEQMGLDRPAPERYFLWLKNITQGSMGDSYSTGRPVTTEILVRIPATLKLMVFSFLISLTIAIPLGVYSATHRYSFIDHLVTFGSFLGLSIPAFWFGLLLIYLFSVWFGLLPAGGYSTPWFNPEVYPLLVRPFVILSENLKYMIMPALVLSLMNMANWSRFVRSSVLEVINENYILTARAKGLPERVVLYKHALRNALTPIITIIGLDLPFFFAGAAVTETIFAWPGMGRLFITSVFHRDYPVLMGVTMVTAFLVLLGSFLADTLYSYLDPRVR